ncbi:MAG: hypothetical protein V4570_03685 [Pseudomonadota bacterium]
MKLLSRLRELRNDYYEAELVSENEHLDTIGIGTTTVDDIIRLNFEHINFQEQAPHAHVIY